MDAAAFRAQFPVLERVAYLNAGTDGPLPAAAVAAARAELDAQERDGRLTAHFERRRELSIALRAAYGRVVGAPPEEIALTTSATDGLGRVLAGLGLGRGDEVLTSDQEHPGLLGPLLSLRRQGVRVRTAPFAELPAAVGPDTTLVALSHVSWVSGELAPAALSELGVPVVLDGAQGAGAIPVDVHALGCAAYAATGQKWLCGPDGIGFLWIDPAFAERVAVVSAGYMTFADPAAGLDGEFVATAARYDTPALGRDTVAAALAALLALEGPGLAAVQERAAALSRRFAAELAAAGRDVAPRGPTTLVSWHDPAAEATRDRLLGAGVAIRDLPGRGLLRASVGAWNDEGDLARLLSALG